MMETFLKSGSTNRNIRKLLFLLSIFGVFVIASLSEWLPTASMRSGHPASAVTKGKSIRKPDLPLREILKVNKFDPEEIFDTSDKIATPSALERQEVSVPNAIPIPEPTVLPVTDDGGRADMKRKLIGVRGNKARVSVPTAPLAPNANAIRNLPGCTSNTLAANDDESTGPVGLPFTINYFGRRYTQTFVNNNGNITFNEPLGDFTPFPLTTTNTPIIAPFFADVDTTRTGSGLVQYGNTTVNSRTAFCVNWVNVGYYVSDPLDPANPDLFNSFQLILIDRSDTGPGNFDMEFNYNRIVWETGDADDGTKGQGGSSARAGYTNGTALKGTYYEFPGSAVNGGLEDSNSSTGLTNNSRNIGVVLGRYVFTASVELIGFEVTQAVQDLSNSVPLVANKRTFIRAYVKPTAAGSGANMSAFLTGTNSNGVTAGRLYPSNPGGTVRVLDNLQRSTLLDSFYFELPPDWIKAGTLQFKIESPDAAIACSEKDSVPDCASTVTFNTVNPLGMKFLLQTYKDAAGVSHTSTVADYLRASNEVLGRYPIDRINVDFGNATTTQNPCLGDAQFTALNVETNTLRNTECLTGTCKKYYQALLTDLMSSNCLPNGGTIGMSDLPGHASASFAETIFTFPNGNKADISDSRIHELGHGTGLKHTDGGQGEVCGDAAGNLIPCTRLEGYGTISFDIDQYGPNTVYGFDVNNTSPTRRIFEPGTYDFMSYNRPTWMSRANYTTLYNKFRIENTQAENAESVDTVTVAQAVNISGSVLLNGTSGSIDSVFVSNTGGTVTMPSPGTYALRFETAQGTQLASYSFEPTASSGNVTVGSIALQLPWDPATKRIVLLHNGQVLASRQASANSPIVRVTSPNGGETLGTASATFTWTASDADGDRLTYLLEYSQDNGATWKALAVNWNTTSFPVDTSLLPASSQALFRVIASDGLNTAQDQSDAVFTVPPHAPQAFISTPENNHLYVGEQTIILSGMAFDIEEGMLPGTTLRWSSNFNGTLGTGGSIAVNASTLVEGTHTITLTATDSTGRIGTSSISIRVFRNRPVFPAALDVAPAGLNFSAGPGSVPTAAQILAIRNSGDGNLTWSATANQPWIRMDATAGSAPFNLSVTAAPTGLAAGQYTGSITITSAGIANSPQTVPVAFSVTQAPLVTVSGRVLTSDGRGLRNATVSITDSTGVARTATTSSFGFFSFANITPGGRYVFRVQSRSYRFSAVTVTINDNLTLPDFVGLE